MSLKIKIFFISLILSFLFWSGLNFFQENLENFFYAQIGQPFEKIVFIQVPRMLQKTPPELAVNSVISLKIDARNRENILIQKNQEEVLPIASITKLMTAMTLLEIVSENEKYDLQNTWITVSQEAANQKDVPVYGNLIAGQRFNLKQLLDLILIYSSNDAAYALAEFFGIENFVGKMNEKVEKLGLEKTNFVNPTGLDPENLYFHPPNQKFFNYSTAEDLAKIAKYILNNENEKIRSIFEISLQKGPYLTNNGVSDFSIPEKFNLIGGKTGFTFGAGGCILLVLEDKNKNIFINVILGAESSRTRIEEMQKIIDWLNE